MLAAKYTGVLQVFFFLEGSQALKRINRDALELILFIKEYDKY